MTKQSWGCIWRETQNRLRTLGIEHEARWLIEWAWSAPFAQCLAQSSEAVVAQEPYARLQSALIQRERGVPLAYILGTAPFMGKFFKVSPAVLIPRPDTETLVRAVVEWAQKIPQNPAATPINILELGVGAGANLCLIAQHLHPLPIRLVGIDLSASALSIAKHNLHHHRVSAQLIASNWLARCPQYFPPQHFHMIFANPPYIDADDPLLIADGIRAEPRLALVADDQGFGDLARIIHHAPRWLAKGGVLILEHGAGQGQQCRNALANHHYLNIQTCRDEGGRERVSLATFD